MSALPQAIYEPDLPQVVRIGPGLDVEQADWDLWANRDFGLYRAFHLYLHEHTIAEGRDPKRIITVVKHACRVWAPDTPVAKLDRAAVRHYTATRSTEGAKGATIRRELALVQAALNHNLKEERIKVVPKFVKPPPGQCRLRWLTEDEHRCLMQLPKESRTQRFLILAFGTGARSQAIEELTWTRVDFENGLIDFRVPNVIYRNKRRVIVPISDDLMPRLRSMYERRTDDFVIGAGGCTYRKVKECLRAIGIDEVGIARHVARHTFASWRLQKGKHIEHVAKLLGDTTHMVEKVYGHVQPQHLRDAVNL